MFFSNTSNMITTIIALVITIVLCLVIYKLIKINYRKYKEENDTITESALSKVGMNKAIDAYIKRVGNFGNFSMIYLDIDNFTSTNDIFGREQCDEFLVQITNRIIKRLPFKALVSKYNNDEFLILIKEAFNYDQVVKISEALLKEIRQKIHVTSYESITLTASSGVVLYPSCGTKTDELIANLELATYISKRQGGNRTTVYYSAMSIEETSNYIFYKEVKNAISNKEFVLYYQPIIDIQHNEIYAFEALMRWNHPVQGILPPAKFINVLEQSGDIYWVGQWGLELMISKIKELNKLFPDGKARVSLNLSTKQLTYEKLADDFIKLAKRTAVEVSSVILEISGYTMFEKMENVKSNLLKLRDAGFTIAVDGFGLDYSTIAKIEKEPIDIIKLDRSFLENIHNNQIKEKFVKMLVDSAKISNRMVIAEGIETDEMERYVNRQEIEFGQGYYYSKPMSEDLIQDFVRYRRWDKSLDSKPKSVEIQESKIISEDTEEIEEK